MKRKLWIILAIAVLTAALCMSTAVADQSGTLTDSISWTLTDDGTLTITGSGAIPNYSIRTNPSPFKSNMSIRAVVIGSGITRIGNSTFSSCSSSLTSVSLPRSLTSIGTEAFLNSTGLTSVRLPEALTSIDRYAFGRSGLTSIAIPASVTTVDEYSFYECASLTEAYVLNSSAVFGSNAFGNLSSGFVLHGWAGSTAETYALENGVSFSTTMSDRCGANAIWTLDTTSLTLTISGTGNMYGYVSGNTPWYEHRDEIETLIIEDGITAIGNNDFEDLTQISHVIIPEGVTRIGFCAFRNCYWLNSLTLPSTLTTIEYSAFAECGHLTSVDIPANVASIGYLAFTNCTMLSSVTINNPECSLGEGIFSGCTGVTLHGWPGSTAETYAQTANIPFDSTFSGVCGANVNWTLNANNGLLTISGTGPMMDYNYTDNRSPFRNNQYISSIVFSGNVTSIGNYAFSGCSNVTGITIPDSVTSIGNSAFSDTGLTSVTIPYSVTNIGFYAFAECYSLSSATIYNPAAVIGDDDLDVFENSASGFTLLGWSGSTTETYAQATGVTFDSLGSLTGSCGDNVTYSFDPVTGALTISGTGEMTNFDTTTDVPWYSYRDKIMSVIIGNGVNTIGSYAFWYTCLTSVTIPESVTSIGSYAFFGCTGLTSVAIPDSVTRIGDSSFYGCTGLTSFTIPDSVTSIGRTAFYGCTGLTSVNIPDSVTSISNHAFYGCTGLASVIIPDSVTTIGDGAFSGCTSLAFASIMNPNCVIGSNSYDVFKNCASGFTLRGYSGSTAEAYAANTVNPCAFESLGSQAIETGSCGDNVTWTLDLNTGLLTISGAGAMTDFSISVDVPWYSYRETITSVSIGSGVTSICINAFNRCTSLTSITIPNSVTRIGYFAFQYCTSLTSITIPDSVTSIDFCAFSDCSSLTSATIMNPNCVIGTNVYNVFQNCAAGFTLRGYSGSTAEAYAANTVNPCAFESLGDLPIPIQTGSCGDNVTYSFNPATGALTISGTGATYDYYYQNNRSPFDANETITSVTFSAGITRIGSWLLDDCANLTSVSIPSTVETIGEGAFYGCGLTELTIPEGVTVLEKWAFNYNTHMNTLLLPDTLTTIGVAPFANCSSLTSVTIPDSVTSIGVIAFAKCTKLTSVTILNPDCVIGDSNFDVFNDCSSGMVLRGLTNSTADFYAQAAGITFESLGTHTGVLIGSCGENLIYSLDVATRALNITGTGEMVNYSSAEDVPWYGYHSGITSVSISNGVTSIGYWAFADCTSLTSVTIPDSVTSIGYCAFNGCTSLISATILNPDCVIGDDDCDVFTGCASGFTLHGYSGSTAEAYAANTKNPCSFEAIAVPSSPDFKLPSGLTAIEAYAFQGIAAEAVLIPASVTAIEGNPFALSQVQYIFGTPGTAAETFANSNGYTFMPVGE